MKYIFNIDTKLFSLRHFVLKMFNFFFLFLSVSRCQIPSAICKLFALEHHQHYPQKCDFLFSKIETSCLGKCVQNLFVICFVVYTQKKYNPGVSNLFAENHLSPLFPNKIIIYSQNFSKANYFVRKYWQSPKGRRFGTPGLTLPV